MPRKKAPKRKVKEVVVPEGDEGKNLSKLDRAAKLESFIEQFNQEVELRLEELDELNEKACSAIDSAGRSLILSLTPEEAQMTIFEKRKSILEKGSRKESLVEGNANLSAIFKEASNMPSRKAPKESAQTVKGKKKVAGFATPATGANRQTLWTATPTETPLFDKRLLNIAADKPTGLSFNGQPIDVTRMSKAKKKQLSQQLVTLLQQLK